jgi:thioredoxin reductase
VDANRLTQKSQEALHDAQTKALRYGHTEVDGEHLLLALLEQPDGLAPRLVAAADGDPDKVRAQVESELQRRPKVSGPGAQPGQIFVTQRLSRLLDVAEREAKRLKDDYVSIEHLLVALIEEGSGSPSGRLFNEAGINRDTFLQGLISVRGNQRVTSAMPEVTYEALAKYGRDLVADANQGRMDPVIGRDSEIRRVIQILSRKTKNNPVLIGEPGVGKTAIEAVRLSPRKADLLVHLDDGTQLRTRTVVIATGARYRKLDVPRLHEFAGTSVSYAATFMEATYCHKRPVSIVGGGNSAGQATVLPARRAASVRLIIRHHDLTRDMSRYLVDQIEWLPNVEVLRSTEVGGLVGEDGRLGAVVARNTVTGDQNSIPTAVLIVFIGADPCTGWLANTVALDDRGYVLTGRDAGDDPSAATTLETSRPGVLAVGDVRSGSIKRVASAVGEGAMAVRLLHEYLARTGRNARVVTAEMETRRIPCSTH